MTDRPVVLLTGASRGIGAATAIEFARRGYDLALTATTAATLERSAAEARSLGADAMTMAGDLADLAFAERLVHETARRFGRIDALVNNAAWREITTMRQIGVESWDRTLRICVTAPAFLARWAAAHMELRGRGVVVNVSSIVSTHAAGTAPAYVAAKGAMDALTYELAALYGPSGIRVVGVSPGAIDTELSADYEGTEGENVSAALRQWTEDVIPLRRWGTAEEAARAIAWVASGDAAYVTGTTIVVDGGWSHQLHPYSLKHRMQPGQFR
jgi:3-oxoacyl-[acyl-carrier protein] reductase